ncbi:MAG TPA: radical SAM protein [Terriglobales bacterium]
MPLYDPPPSLMARDLLSSWGQILRGRVPILSIEITRECPLSCPGCYAYGDSHLAGTTLRQLSDFRGDALVEGVVGLVQQHRPLHVSLVGGEPLVRHRELDRILPRLAAMNVFTMVVTSAVVPIPQHWMKIPRLRIAVSVDGLPEHHDVRRKPATYERILKNVAGTKINVHWVITRPMMERRAYLQEYLAFWNERPEVEHIWTSLYSPQMGEESAEILSQSDRARLAAELPGLRREYPKLMIAQGMAQAILEPPCSPDECLFAKMSVNYSADLKTRVEPCVFGGTPDCRQCGCGISTALHWIKDIPVAGPLKIDHLVRGSMAVGSAVAKITDNAGALRRWGAPPAPKPPELVNIT